MKRSGIALKDEVGDWDQRPRGQHRAVADHQDGMGDNPWADDVIRELASA
jgi:hypothetical protein